MYAGTGRNITDLESGWFMDSLSPAECLPPYFFDTVRSVNTTFGWLRTSHVWLAVDRLVRLNGGSSPPDMSKQRQGVTAPFP